MATPPPPFWGSYPWSKPNPDNNSDKSTNWRIKDKPAVEDKWVEIPQRKIEWEQAYTEKEMLARSRQRRLKRESRAAAVANLSNKPPSPTPVDSRPAPDPEKENRAPDYDTLTLDDL